ncbi:xanthine dehydrogenase accessory protein XdhC [Agarivorans sp. TSD2052]|uniref:xanthine dehydrogenase accessory protein XdhC n=1 Tax=Agarivorans sp. TSD2052 TaxID=2937286 RepID=UPI00200FBBDF|nr:xanthine dehydrogenase accessory protein XdhC [Agarivorans sp. TSD2052]UPW17046.1 xanthine dehydrogenase accessory protein XdhC [Agarivorans sp. TSD2052]
MPNWSNSLLPNNWLDACQYLKQQQQAFCIATIIAEAGSVPRAGGAKMVISKQQQFDTLGGGNLELSVIKHAREQLNNANQQSQIERFSLAADLAQCCGGAVQVMFEFFMVDQPHITLFGAGHVSHALCQILAQLPYHVTVVDNRQQWLDSIADLGVNTHYHPQPEEQIEAVASNSYVVILTQDHGLDFKLSLAALQRQDLAFVGLIGSQTKAQRFDLRLREQLTNPSWADQLICPIGLSEVSGKLPMQVAVSISAQLISLLQSHQQAPSNKQKKLQWQVGNQLRKQLAGEMTDD